MKEKRDSRGRTEAEAIAACQAKSYPKPALTADIVVFAREGEQWKVLLIRRKNHPFLGCWALPGGFAEASETIQKTAFRELQEETGVVCKSIQLVGVYSKPGRDPRGWIVSVAFTACLNMGCCRIQGADDAAEARWMDVIVEDGEPVVLLPEGEKLAFDHEEILKNAFRRNTILDSAREILNWLQEEYENDNWKGELK